MQNEMIKNMVLEAGINIGLMKGAIEETLQDLKNEGFVTEATKIVLENADKRVNEFVKKYDLG